MKVIGRTDIGFKRSENQDKYLAGKLSDNCFFGFVCDGMGGVNGGKIASSLITENLEEFLYMNEFEKSFDDEEVVLTAIDKANLEILTRAKANENLKGMGSTLTGFTLINDKLRVYNVGDSRTYVFRKGKLTQITEDHSIAYELYKNGTITKEEVASYPQKNYITRAIGVSDEVEVDMYTLTLEKDDIILAVSDGLSNFVLPSDIENIIINNKDIYLLADELLNKALKNRAGDNVTVVTALY